VLMNQWLHCFYGTIAEGGRQLPGDFVVTDRVHLPSDTPQIFATILEVRFRKGLQPFGLRRVDVHEGLRVAKHKLIGRDAYDAAVFAEAIFHGPWISSREPRY